VEIDGKKLLDGGVCDPIPIEKAMQEFACDRWICVLTRTEQYRKKPGGSRLARWRYKRYPAFVEALQTRGERYNATLDQIARWQQQGDIFVIRPSQDFGVHRMEKNAQKLLAQYNLGYADTLACISQLQTYLAQEFEPRNG
jgi:predicted patatin/cPLA2 family phospholipase